MADEVAKAEPEASKSEPSKPPAKRPPPTKSSERVRTIVSVAVGAMFANAAFFILSYVYYKAHAVDLGEGSGVGSFKVVDEVGRAHARESFALLSAIVGIAMVITSEAPREIGHALALLLGLASLTASYGAFDRGLPGVMTITLLIVGVLMPALAYGSWKKSRASWAFLIALVAVFGGVDLFGAPKVRNLLGIGLWTAMIVPGLQVVTVYALTTLRADYRFPTTTTATATTTTATATKA